MWRARGLFFLCGLSEAGCVSDCCQRLPLACRCVRQRGLRPQVAQRVFFRRGSLLLFPSAVGSRFRSFRPALCAPARRRVLGSRAGRFCGTRGSAFPSESSEAATEVEYTREGRPRFFERVTPSLATPPRRWSTLGGDAPRFHWRLAKPPPAAEHSPSVLSRTRRCCAAARPRTSCWGA